MHSETDVLIIGAGIAGCTAAIALADQYRITLIDKKAEPMDRIGESLVPAARRIMRQLDLIQNQEEERDPTLWIRSPGMQSYWGSDKVRYIDHLFNPDGCVFNLDRGAFETFLRAQAVERGVKGLWPVAYYTSIYDDSKWKVIVRSDGPHSHAKTHCISARYVIDSSGRQSRFARSRKIRRDSLDNLITCWASMTDETNNKMSTISAGEKGWWYSASVPDSRRVMAYQTDIDLIDRRAFSDESYFVSLVKANKEMNFLFQRTAGPLHLRGSVSSNSTKLQKIAGKQWVALGDAAMSFDPLSSQGMFHAMASAMLLKDLINHYDCIRKPSVGNIELFQREYTSQMDRVWQQYLRHHSMYYRSEQRWKDRPFWKRRSEMQPVDSR